MAGEDDERLTDLLHEAIADDFLERPAASASSWIPPLDVPRFNPGDLLADRFRIVRLIGRGGMGEVYEAIDIELGTPVALKTIRARIASDERVVARFRREVLRARTVAHRHVCRVYDLFAHQIPNGPVVRFLTMELLPGETLAQHLAARGSLSPDETLRIAQQVASALDEAHRLQIVHRDLKPGNIMLIGADDDLRAVVSDFGLALQLSETGETERGFTSEARGGTDDYMAPEQREDGAIGPAADIYAFGVVLHEMLTGQPPREGVSNALPTPWAASIRACLQEDPAARPASATAVLPSPEAAPPRPLWRRVTSSGVAITAMLLMIGAGLSLFSPLSRFLSMTPPASSARLVLLPLTNATGEAELDAVSDLLRYQLRQSMFLDVLDPQQVTTALRRMARPVDEPVSLEQMRDVAWRQSGDVMVSGRITKASGGYVLGTRLEQRGGLQPDAVGQNWSKSFEARDRDELRLVVREAGRWLRATAGEAASEIPRHDRPVEEVTSSSWEAVALFSRAEALSIDLRQDDALALLAEAVRIDPDFALAWMRMGDILMSRRQLREAAERWHTALHVLDKRQLSPREEYRLRGIYASDTHDYVEAERVYRLWLLSYPNDPKPFFYIARPLLMLGRSEDAVAMMTAARTKDPTAYYIPVHLASLNLRAGHFDAAAQAIAMLRPMGQGSWADCLQGQLEFLTGSYESAIARFESLEQSDNVELRNRAFALQAAVLADLGRTDEAIARLKRGIDRDVKAGAQAAQADKLLALASLQLRLGQKALCRDLCVQLEQVDDSERRLAQAASLLARAGFPADAERLLARLDPASTIRSVQVDRHRVAAEIMLARQNKSAWDEFKRAAALDATGVPIEYLVRGAEAAGEYGTAIALAERMANDPGYYWYWPDLDPPGTWSDAMRTYLRLAGRYAPATDTSAVQNRLRALQSTMTATALRADR